MTYQTDKPVAKLPLTSSAITWGSLARDVDAGDITLDAPYQRGQVWTTGQQMMLIHSILSGTPIPAIIINHRPREQWFAADGTQLPVDAVIDGKQRLTAVHTWLSGDLAVPASWFPADEVEDTEDTGDGPYVRYWGLSVRMQRFFTFSAHVPVAEGTVATVAEEAAIYLRVNGSGTAQTQDDMDRATEIAGD